MKASEILSHFDEVTPEGDAYVAICPEHGDATPSLRIAFTDARKLILKCRSHGCSYASVMKAAGLKPRDGFDVELDDDAIRATSSRAVPVGIAETAALAGYIEHCARLLQADNDEARTAREYVSRRFGVDASLAKHLRLGFAPEDDDYNFAYLTKPYTRVPRLVVPFLDADGRARAVQARDLSGRDSVRWCGLKNPDGAAWSKIAVFDLETGLDIVFVTEGPGDGLTCAAAGYDAVAVRGAALASGATVVEELLPFLTDRRVIVAGDGDAAGAGFNDQLAQRLVEHGITVQRLTPPDGLDLSAWRERDPDAFADELAAAVRAAQIVRPRRRAPEPEPGRGVPGRGGYARTDLGNAKRLLDHFDRKVKYAPEIGFYIYDGAVWQVDKFDEVRAAAHKVAEAIVTEGAGMIADGLAEAGKALVQWGEKSQDSNRLTAMVRELSVMPGVAVDVERMDAHHDLLAFRNGVVNLRTGALMNHDPALLLTRMVDVDYDPDATAPTWDYFLSSVFPNHPDLPTYMRRLVGYGITGHTSEQCFAVLWGTGSNGKSVFTDTLTSVFRAITVTTPFSTFEAKPSGGIPNDLAALKGARLVMASEGEQGKPMAEAVMKRITGSDMISARFMRKEFFEFAPTFLIFLGTNYKPNFRGQDEGLWRRVKLIPWKRYFAPNERDHYLTTKLRAEAQGIVAWAVRGAVEWYREGLGDPGVVKNATQEYRETSDALAGFLPGILVHGDEHEYISGAEAYHEYTEWAAAEGLPDRERWTRRTFYGALEERGIVKARHASGLVLKGLRRARPGETAESPRADGGFPALVASDPQKAPSLDDIHHQEESK